MSCQNLNLKLKKIQDDFRGAGFSYFRVIPNVSDCMLAEECKGDPKLDTNLSEIECKSFMCEAFKKIERYIASGYTSKPAPFPA